MLQVKFRDDETRQKGKSAFEREQLKYAQLCRKKKHKIQRCILFWD